MQITDKATKEKQSKGHTSKTQVENHLEQAGFDKKLPKNEMKKQKTDHIGFNAIPTLHRIARKD